MKAKIEITIDNAAFEDMGHASELGRILRDLAHGIENNGETGPCSLLDVNGNKVGSFKITGGSLS